MFEVSIDGKNVKADVTFHTCVLYEAEFKKDLLRDFFGDTLKVDEQIQVDEEQNIVNIDFERIDWTAANRALWAAIKTADDSVPYYAEWSKKTKGVNMFAARNILAAEVADCFFRAEVAEEDEGEG